ncbi:apoptosis-stimulating of p53 protein 2-like isoform X2 [Lethenteron reissneri]|uniref:apoptosis-stimulating of p53 protein 2-like isoform X2 n=1 Tax=Lethenteron reissneri TaxID=7753 RepID=UPI002AB5E69A|nr:apoptosis-stimulating of p53 protein 2-like isoform X2 [Lethenteron reissneri]
MMPVILTVLLSEGDQQGIEVPVTPETCCRDVVDFCKEPGELHCHLAQLWRGDERSLPAQDMIYDILQQWGARRDEVKFYLRHDDPPTVDRDPGGHGGRGTMLRRGIGGGPPDNREQRVQHMRQQQGQQAGLGEAEKLQRLRERVESQEAKIRKIRAMRGQVDQPKLLNNNLLSELTVMNSFLTEKQRELSVAVTRVEELTQQLEDLRKGKSNGFCHANLGKQLASAVLDLDRLYRELQTRNRLQQEQNQRQQHRRNGATAEMERRINELREQMLKKKLGTGGTDSIAPSPERSRIPNAVSGRVAAVGPFITNLGPPDGTTAFRTPGSEAYGLPTTAAREGVTRYDLKPKGFWAESDLDFANMSTKQGQPLFGATETSEGARLGGSQTQSSTLSRATLSSADWKESSLDVPLANQDASTLSMLRTEFIDSSQPPSSIRQSWAGVSGQGQVRPRQPGPQEYALPMGGTLDRRPNGGTLGERSVGPAMTGNGTWPGQPAKQFSQDQPRTSRQIQQRIVVPPSGLAPQTQLPPRPASPALSTGSSSSSSSLQQPYHPPMQPPSSTLFAQSKSGVSSPYLQQQQQGVGSSIPYTQSQVYPPSLVSGGSGPRPQYQLGSGSPLSQQQASSSCGSISGGGGSGYPQAGEARSYLQPGPQGITSGSPRPSLQSGGGGSSGPYLEARADVAPPPGVLVAAARPSPSPTDSLQRSQSPRKQAPPPTLDSSSIYSMYTQHAGPSRQLQHAMLSALGKNQGRQLPGAAPAGYGKPAGSIQKPPVKPLPAYDPARPPYSPPLPYGLPIPRTLQEDRELEMEGLSSSIVPALGTDADPPRPLSPTKLMPISMSPLRGQSDADLEALRRKLQHAPRPLKKRGSIAEPETSGTGFGGSLGGLGGGGGGGGGGVGGGVAASLLHHQTSPGHLLQKLQYQRLTLSVLEEGAARDFGQIAPPLPTYAPYDYGQQNSSTAFLSQDSDGSEYIPGELDPAPQQPPPPPASIPLAPPGTPPGDLNDNALPSSPGSGTSVAATTPSSTEEEQADGTSSQGEEEPNNNDSAEEDVTTPSDIGAEDSIEDHLTLPSHYLFEDPEQEFDPEDLKPPIVFPPTLPPNKRTNLKKPGSERTGTGDRVKFNPLALLLDASLEGEFDLVQRVIYEAEDPSRPNDEGITALHNAVCAGHMNIVRFLVQFGVNVNAGDSDGWTPLHCAASCNSTQLCRFLVETGAAVFAATQSDMETAAEKCDEMEEGYEQCYQFLYGVQEKMGVMNKGVVYALWDLEAESEDELTVREGDALTALRRGDDEETEWWWVRLDEREGYVPRNLLGLYPRIKPRQRSLA